jgi:hypothetical protein
MSESDSEEPEAKSGEGALPGGDFRLFVQKLGYQALISLGVVENPINGLKQASLPQARGVIDDLVMIRDKTEGNLAAEEKEHLDTVISNLQSHFVRLSQSSAGD